MDEERESASAFPSVGQRDVLRSAVTDPVQRGWVELYERRGWELYKVDGRSLEFLRRARWGGNVRVLSVMVDDDGNVREHERRETMEIEQHLAQSRDNMVATGEAFEPVDRMGWGRGILCFCLAGLIGLWIASANRETPWNAVRWCMGIFMVVTVLIAGYALVSDGGSPTTDSSHQSTLASSRPTSPPVPGYRSFHSDRFGYSIQLPHDWDVLPSETFVYQDETYYVDVFLAPEDSVFTTNLNINGGATNGESRSQVYTRAVADAESRHDNTRVEDIEIFGQPAKRLTYTAGDLTNQEPFDQQQIIVVYGDKEMVLSFSTALGEIDLHQEVFDTIAGTFTPD